MVETAASASKRRLPFKRTAARKKTPDADAPSAAPKKDADDSDEGIQFFRRNQDSFSYMEDIEPPKDKATRAASPVDLKPLQTGHDAKRRKVSTEPERSGSSGSASASDVPSGALQRNQSSSSAHILVLEEGSPATRSSAINEPIKIPAKNAFPAVISLSDDDSGELAVVSEPRQTLRDGFYPSTRGATHARGLTGHTRIPPSKAAPAQDDDDSDIEVLGVSARQTAEMDNDLDDEFALEIEQARARARERAAQASGASEPGSTPRSNIPVDIVIDAPSFKGSFPLQAKIHINQPLQRILLTWVHWQGTKGRPVQPEAASQLFLTWRRTRVYGSASVSTLPDVEFDAYGNLLGNAAHGRDGGFHDGGLHFEVWTEELLAEEERKRQRERHMSLGILDDEDLEAPEAEAPPEDKPKGIRVILKAKELEPVKLTVQAHTTVSTMIDALRQQRDVAEGTEVILYFDGDQLDPDTSVAELDIDPDETNQLEVHIR